MKTKKNIFLIVPKISMRVEILVPDAFKSGLFPLKSTKGTGLKILLSKKMFQR